MQQAGGQGFIKKRRGKAEDVDVADELGAHAGAKGVTVHADDAGERAAVRVQGRGAVVGLDLEDQAPLVVEANDPGVVLEDRQAPVAGSHLGADGLGGGADVGIKQAVDGGGLAADRVFVGDVAAKDLVLAVLGPGLGQHLELDVGDPGRPAQGLPRGRDLGPGKVGADDLHLIQGQGQHALLADPHKVSVGDVQVHLGNPHRAFARYLGGKGLDAAGRSELLVVHDGEALDQFIGQELGGDGLHLLARQRACKQELGGGVDRLVARQPAAQQVAQGLGRGPALVVRDPGPETHLDQPVKGDALLQGELPQGPFLGYRVAVRAGGRLPELLQGDVRLHGEHPEGAHRGYRQMQVGLDSFFGLFAK